MKMLLNELMDKQRALAREMEERFAEFFASACIPSLSTVPDSRSDGPTALIVATPDCPSQEIDAAIRALPSRSGLYVVLTDFPLDDDKPCEFKVGSSPLKAIYRGHSSNIRERVMGHLTNKCYLDYCRSKKNKKPWGSYLRITDDEDGDGGIDLSERPYSGYTWAVVAYEMPGSTEPIRELAENGFSAAFGTPVRSRKEPNRPNIASPAMQN